MGRGWGLLPSEPGSPLWMRTGHQHSSGITGREISLGCGRPEASDRRAQVPDMIPRAQAVTVVRSRPDPRCSRHDV